MAPPQGNAMDSLGISVTTRPISTVSTRDGAHYTFENNTIREPTWTAADMAGRPHLLATFPWSMDDASHTSLYESILPDSIFQSSQLALQAFQSFQYWRGGMEIHAQVTGTPFHQGSIIVAYNPCEDFADYNRQNFCSLTAMQHVFVQANSSTAAKMIIPFIYPNDYYALTDDTSNWNPWMGTLSVTVFNQLYPATSASSPITVSLFARFIDSEFKVPAIPFNWDVGLRAESLGLGRIIQKMLPKNIIADTIDTIAGFFGLDKPCSTEMTPPAKILATGYMNSAVAVEYNDKFSLFPYALTETAPTDFSTTVSEMSHDVLKRKYTYIGSFDQYNSYVSGKLLATIPLQPNPMNLSSGLGNDKVCLLQYLCYPFQQWRGGLTYKLQAVATNFHTTKIFVSINYGWYSGGPTPIDDPLNYTAQYGFAFELNQGASEFEFTVPYVAATHSKYVSNDNENGPQNSLGTMNIYVVNRLAMPNTVSSKITYNVFLAGAEDFSLSTVSYVNNSLIPVGDAGEPNQANFLTPTLLAESLVVPLVSDTEHPIEPLVVSPVNDLKSLGRSEPPVSSIAELLKKFTLVYSFGLQTRPTISPQSPLLQTNSIGLTSLLFGSGTYGTPHSMAYYASLFGGFRGPLRIKAFIRDADPSLSLVVTYIPPYSNATGNPFSGEYIDDCSKYVNTSLAGAFAPTETTPFVPQFITRNRTHLSVVSGPQRSAEIEIPFTRYNNIAWFDSSRPITDEMSSLGYIVVTVNRISSYTPTTSQYPIIDIYMAFGDESRFAILRQIPRLIVNKHRGTSDNVAPDTYTSTIGPGTLTVL